MFLCVLLATTMLRFERQAKILQIINERGFIENEELAEFFDVTQATIRRDLKNLAEQNLVKIDHGGSSSMDFLGGFIEPRYETKLYFNITKKMAIAAAAVGLIQDGEAIILDSGTTNMHIARKLRTTNLKNLTVITCDIQIAAELCPEKNMDVVVLGGMLRKSYYSSFGPYARYVLENLRADKAFLGVDAASKETGVTNAALEEIPIKQTMIEVSNETIMVTDSTKFYTHVPYRVCGWDRIDWIVTDDGVSQDYVDFFKQQGLKVTLVHPVRDNDDV